MEALEWMPAAVVTVDRHDRITFANGRTIDLFGYSSRELLGAPIAILIPHFGLTGRTCGSERDDGGSAVAKGTTSEILLSRTRDGDVFHVEVSSTNEDSESHKTRIVVIAGRDVCREVDGQRAEMAHLSRVASLGTLVSSLAHELNQPLTSILFNIEAAQKLVASGGSNDAEVRAAFADIIQDISRGTDIIRGIRTMARKGGTDMCAVDMEGVVRDMVLLVRGEAVARGVHTKVTVAESLTRVYGDKVQLQQVVLNLLMNALDAAMECDPHDRTVETTAWLDDGGGVRITVKDPGHGLTVPVSQIFEPFFTTKPHGLGLGLPISRSIVAAHGGRIWAENNAGKGASFHVWLPQMADTQRDHSPAS